MDYGDLAAALVRGMWVTAQITVGAAGVAVVAACAAGLARSSGKRLLRCHPWCAGGLDPVPAQTPQLFFLFNEKKSP